MRGNKPRVVRVGARTRAATIAGWLRREYMDQARLRNPDFRAKKIQGDIEGRQLRRKIKQERLRTKDLSRPETW